MEKYLHKMQPRSWEETKGVEAMRRMRLAVPGKVQPR